MTTSNTLPGFLQNADAFAAHIYDLFDDENSNAKGDAFVEFAMKLAPFWPAWGHFPDPEPNSKKSHDKGVDFFSKDEEANEWVCGQSKYRIKEKIEIDQIVGKFRNFEQELKAHHHDQGSQLPLIGNSATTKATARKARRKGAAKLDTPGPMPTLRYIVVTSSEISNLIQLYESSSLGSRAFYDELKSDRRIDFLYGDEMLQVLQEVYRQNYIMSPDVQLVFDKPYVKSDNIYLSLMSGAELARLHSEHGSALFFENIREFLGVSEVGGGGQDEEAVNYEIMKTLQHSPAKMASRNNGITIKADHVTIVDETTISLEGSSIVNGCQTTMCVVNADPDRVQEAKIVVKVVEGGDPWDIAKSTNYQNRVSKIDLELARFLRPQLVRKSATDMGYGLPPAEDQQTVSNILESIHRERVSYDAVRVLYLGLFSRFPNNMFSSNYSEVRVDILSQFGAQNQEEQLLNVLFRLYIQIREAARATQEKLAGEEEYTQHFKRFFNENKPQYQCLLGILAACGCAEDDLSDKPANDAEAFQRMARFVEKIDGILSGNTELFNHMFRLAFVVVSGAISNEVMRQGGDVSQQMFRVSKSIAGDKFRELYAQTRLQYRLTMAN